MIIEMMAYAGSRSRNNPTSSFAAGHGVLLQHKCPCGAVKSSLAGMCEDCQKRALKRRLAVGASNDPLELEADRVADRVLAKPAQAGGAAPRIRRYAGQPASETAAAPASVEHVLARAGRPLEPALRRDMEQRFGHDFSQVRVHTDTGAADSARSIQALAYTAGHSIVFGAGRYLPGTESGKRLLAHELAHVVQQRGDQNAHRVFRFSDTDHHILEEAALELTNLTSEEIKQIHAGNVKRDYSQTGAVANLLLLCDKNAYGGYKDVEHFDDYQWSEVLQKWQSKENPGAFGKKSPISYIDEELVRYVDSLPGAAAFEHVGNAFHTIEDFFAHSNFVELISGDFRFGKQLVTGGGGSGDTSVLRILESVSSEETAPFYGQQAGKETAKSPSQAHARMAKDYKSNPYYEEARLLTALVIHDIGSEIRVVRDLGTKEERLKYVRDVIMAKVKRYLRPPDESDKWWEALRASGGKEMEKAVKEKTAKTPVTKNQCMLSPLRSIEASKQSNLKLFGPAFPIETKRGHVWVQVGTGFLAPPAFKRASGEMEPRSFAFVPIGAQITGTFDWLK